MRWSRYEVTKIRPDSPITYREGAYPTRWLANWAAARRIQRCMAIDDDTRYAVYEKDPAVKPGDWWHELRVLQASRHHPIPSASVMAGSTVVHLCLGITRWHALGRACKWAKPRSRQSVRVSRWGDEPTIVPDETSIR